MNSPSRNTLITPSASAEEAAAVVAAIARLARDSAPVSTGEDERGPAGPWREAALREGVSRGLLDAAPWE